jgi:hypothetical protein
MEKRINKKLELYVTKFKDDIKTKILSVNIDDNSKINDVLEFVYDYERIVLDKDDFIKRKRIKNSIPNVNRCVAKRANGEQCTRRRKPDSEYCGTHCKGIPHGSMQENAADGSAENIHSMDVFTEDIKGIVYFIDKFNNVYNTEDILSGIENPKIIAKAVKTYGVYSIPELGI